MRKKSKMRTFLKFAGILSVTVATGGVGFLFAAPIAATLGAAGLLGAASTGTGISTLAGAALVKASLAAIGGGALGTGSTALGITGGITAITGSSAAAGAAISGVAAKLLDKSKK